MQKFFFLSAPDNLFIQVSQFIKSNQTFLIKIKILNTINKYICWWEL
jgi:hypothetical protein